MAGSEELERSLRSEVGKQIDALVGEHRDEVLRAQRELNDALARFTERLSGGAGSEQLAGAISEHLRNARNAGVDEAARSSAGAGASGDVALIKAAVDEIDSQRTQSDILNALVNRAASFAPRVAFFVVKNERATGWRARGLEGSVGDDRVRDISLPLSADTVLSEVYRTRTAWSGAPGSKADDYQLLSKLGEEPPARMVAVPLVARDKCVAVLYADSAGLEPDAINLEALETLVRVTGMAVELLAVKRTAPAQASISPSSAEPSSNASASSAARPATDAASSPASSSESQTQSHSTEAAHSTEAQLVETHASFETTARDASDVAATTTAEAASTTEAASTSEAAPALEVAATPEVAPSHETSPSSPEAAAQATGPHVAPLGTSRRYGQDAELPVEVSDEERRFHNDARRFARLLVSEIKLYNEQKVKDGREHADIYTRLREEIDRSRQMYDKRVHPSVVPRYDYFHHELVNTLAEGDASRLGAGYPGATGAA
ncbi:MAG: hypothetical protein QOE33_2735 [Acidobacteriota bacterium]|nr:hypothetical protein [Acidobacteriota bacterium]